MIAGLHHRRAARRMRGVFAVHLHPYLHAGIRPHFAALTKSGANLLDGFPLGNFFGNTVGTDLDPEATEFASEFDKATAFFDILADDGLVGRVKFANRPEG